MAEKPTRKAMLEQALGHVKEIAAVDDAITEGDFNYEKMRNSKEYREKVKKVHEKMKATINENLQRLEEFITTMEVHLVEMSEEEQALFIQLKFAYKDIHRDAKTIFGEIHQGRETPLRLDDKPGGGERYQDYKEEWESSKDFTQKHFADDPDKDALTMILYFNGGIGKGAKRSYILDLLTDEGENTEFKEKTERFRKYPKEFVQIAQAQEGNPKIVRKLIDQRDENPKIWQRFEENSKLFVRLTQTTGMAADSLWTITEEMSATEMKEHATDIENIFKIFKRHETHAALTYFMAIGKIPLHENEIKFIKANPARLANYNYRDIAKYAAKRDEIIKDPQPFIDEITKKSGR